MVQPTPVILTGIPGHFNARGYNLDNYDLLWSPLRLTNYEIDVSGPGAIYASPASLVNSTLSMGWNETLGAGPMTLQNSHLSVGTISGSSSITATNHSTISVSLSDTQAETFNLRSSTLNIFGEDDGGGSFTCPITMDRGSTVNISGIFGVDKGQNFNISSTGAGLGTVYEGVHGGLNVSGRMTVDANIIQVGDTNIDVTNNGHLTLAGSVTGTAVSEIAITSGTLEFSQAPGFMHRPETASQNFNSKLAFVGTDGAVQFDGFSQLLINVMPQVDDLQVFSNHQKIADFHLAPTHAYSVTDFSVHGNELIYHHVG